MKKNDSDILQSILALQDKEYKQFMANLTPNIEPDTIIGVRTPPLRALAKEIIREGKAEGFLSELPHRYFEENQLHAFIVSEEKGYSRALELIDAFLPYIDNWATCDQTSPKAFRSHRRELIAEAKRWTASEHTYTIRFGIGTLMRHYLDEDFSPEYPELVAAIKSDEYYVNMMIAWYFATALAKQYDAVIQYLERRSLDTWTHNKAIQKSIESYRVSDGHKEYLRSLKISKK